MKCENCEKLRGSIRKLEGMLKLERERSDCMIRGVENDMSKLKIYARGFEGLRLSFKALEEMLEDS